MNEELVDLTKAGLANLRQLLAGKHLRLAQLALTMVIVAQEPQAAWDVLVDEGAQSRWEVANG